MCLRLKTNIPRSRCTLAWRRRRRRGGRRRRRKSILFPAWSQLPCDPSKPFSNANTAEKPAVSQTLSRFPPSHYLICHCGCAINFPLCPPGAASFASALPSEFKNKTKKQQKKKKIKCSAASADVLTQVLAIPRPHVAPFVAASRSRCTGGDSEPVLLLLLHRPLRIVYPCQWSCAVLRFSLFNSNNQSFGFTRACGDAEATTL